ncbi:hypothetical protein EVAR_52143_1 [Eumeta japonica]|uniref:Uncharacterized protein n=1 Tax=Eumeta variegata TaxID=151549 RepID=A0A4C2A807_EUMVA|nr:hypothetical protein EVAR_52143_1 [Eumeta japonica]
MKHFFEYLDVRWPPPPVNTQPRRSHKCIAGPLGSNNLMEGGSGDDDSEGDGGGGHRNSRSLDEIQQLKLLLHFRIL